MDDVCFVFSVDAWIINTWLHRYLTVLRSPWHPEVAQPVRQFLPPCDLLRQPIRKHYQHGTEPRIPLLCLLHSGVLVQERLDGLSAAQEHVVLLPDTHSGETARMQGREGERRARGGSIPVIKRYTQVNSAFWTGVQQLAHELRVLSRRSVLSRSLSATRPEHT